jgi:hypothetical protein
VILGRRFRKSAAQGGQTDHRRNKNGQKKNRASFQDPVLSMTERRILFGIRRFIFPDGFVGLRIRRWFDFP